MNNNTYDPIMHSMFISMCEQTTISWLLTIEYTSRSDIAFPQLTGEIFSRQFTCSIFCLNTNTTKWGRIGVLFTIYFTLVDFLINPKIHQKINNYWYIYIPWTVCYRLGQMKYREKLKKQEFMFLRKITEKNEQTFFFISAVGYWQRIKFWFDSILQMKHCILIQNNQILGIDEKHFARIDDS